MKGNKKTYWKGIEQLTNDSEFVKHAEKEFPEKLPIKDAYGDNTPSNKTSRRDFLKMMGFSVAAVSLAACETPVKKAIPYLNKPENLDPGIPNYYASTYLNGSDYCSILVKTREGRPIFIEGNTASGVTMGGTDARVNASIMSLYDIERQKEPTKGGQKAKWEDIDKEIISKLKAGGQIRIVTQTVMSPSTKRVVSEFIKAYPSAKHVIYDPISNAGIVEAHKRQFGKAVVPSYDFGKADVIATIGADFLGTWISPTEFTKQFSAGRKVGKDKKEMNRLYAFESILTVTGAAADYRGVYKPSQEGLVVASLYNAVAKKLGGTTISVPTVKINNLDKCADDLIKAKGKALVVSGSNDVAVQLVTNALNELLGSYGNSINLDNPSFQKQGNDADMEQFVKDITGGLGSVIFYNCNPVYDHPKGKAIAAGIKKAKLSVATSDRLDETAKLCQFNAPDNHYLESWNDAEPKKGFFSLGQPAITPIFNTRQVQESLLTWAENKQDYLSFIQDYWKSELFKLQSEISDFEIFWKTSLHHGVFETSKSYKSLHEGANVTISSAVTAPIAATETTEAPAETAGTADDAVMAEVPAEAVAPVSTSGFDVNSVASALKKYSAESTEKELVIYEGVISGSGSQANNPYIQETPDPINKTCWGNVISVSPVTATELGFATKEAFTNVATVKVGGFEATLPVVIQPGQAKGTIAVALGYGRSAEVGKVATEAGGANAFTALLIDGTVRYSITKGVSIADAGETEKLAQTQTHETILGRETIIQETTLKEYQKDPQAGRFFPMIATYKGKKDPKDISLWDVDSKGYKGKDEPVNDYEKSLWNNRNPEEADRHQYPIHHWGMAIDLNSCTGCSACVVACHVENNVTIVGKTEVKNRREMHWLRIDRYYSSDGEAGDYAALELASENPEVVFQPMMCQHCNNAPCETVCPVAATTHSSEGLNQMTYNRCVGTKYCANNCPYKVRRFNWFKYYNNDEFNYHTNNDLGKMVLNPDVTVRSRGVMEKCSMCVQRIQSGKLTAKKESRKVKDGEIITACSAACSAGAITFGDLNDTESKVSKLLDTELKGRAYNVLHEVGTKPNVWYLTKVRNQDEKKEKATAKVEEPKAQEAH